jgi:hypothetical protein
MRNQVPQDEVADTWSPLCIEARVLGAWATRLERAAGQLREAVEHGVAGEVA